MTNLRRMLVEHGAGLLAMALGVALVFSFVLSLNDTAQAPKEKKREGRAIAIAPPPPKPKKKPKPPPRKKPQKRPRKALAPPPNLAGGVSSFQLGDGAFSSSALMGDSRDLIGGGGDAKDLVMTEDSVDSAPRPVSRPAPQYPPRARAKGVTGMVSLSILVDQSGSVKRVKVLDATPKGIFEDAAVQAVRRWRFDAATYRGQKVKVWARQVVRFSLQ